MMTAGAARVEITPPLTVPYLGYVPRHALFEGVHDPLFARAVAVDDGERRVALVAADSIGFAHGLLGPGRQFAAEFRERVQRLTGIPPEAVMLSATHAHSTPETLDFRPLREHPGALAWLETLLYQLASAVVLADRARGPARLKRGSLPVEGVAHCRRIVGRDGRLVHTWQRPMESEIASRDAADPELVLLLFERPEGQPAIVLTHFACHPVTVQVQPFVSADFPGVLAALVERSAPGCEQCLFLQGAAGDINPLRDTTGFADVARYGLTLAGATLQLLGRMAAPEYALAGHTVGAVRVTVELPSRSIPPLGPLEEVMRQTRARLDAARTDEERKALERDALWQEESLLRARRGDAPLAAEVQALRLGDSVLVGIPGEPFGEMGRAMKAWNERLSALCVGYANDYLGYFAPPAAWEEGGYEVRLGSWSQAGPEAHGLLLAAGRKLVRELSQAPFPSSAAASS
jgi:neutral ceramidase